MFKVNNKDTRTTPLVEWFSNNQMKASSDKCHYITSESKDLGLSG